MRLSVIMPNRNHAALLPRSLDALCRQTRQPDEIIVIDDASTDNSRDVIRSFMPRLPQLRLLENAERQGVVPTNNRGLQEATGEVVYCGAADDATDPDMMKTLMAGLEAHPNAAFACAEARLIDDHGHFVGIRPIIVPRWRPGYVSPPMAARLLRTMDNLVLSVVTLYRRDLLLQAGGFKPELGPFSDSFVARAMMLEHGFVFIPGVLGTWYVQSESYSRRASTDVQAISALIHRAQTAIEADAGRIFPSEYSKLFVRRAQFASARLAVIDPVFDPSLIADLAHGDSVTRFLLRTVAGWPRTARQVAALGWLALVLRPMSLPRLFGTALLRRTRDWIDWRPSSGMNSDKMRLAARG